MRGSREVSPRNFADDFISRIAANKGESEDGANIVIVLKSV
jgi:hypothetical protein